MSGVHHRKMGLAGFVLTDSVIYAELIGDLVHVGKEGVDLALAARRPEGLCLVSDALAGAGTGCDVFESHGRKHEVHDGAAYYPPREPGSARQLAGSAMGQLDMVRRLVRRGVVDLLEALWMGTWTPAHALGLQGELGVLAPGARADWIVLEPETLELLEVRVAGHRVPLGSPEPPRH
jgi:N-acetylglucosamine-6-phosphate deacetylase